MIAFARETLFDVVGEIEPLLRQHYEELTLNKDRIVLNPMWDEYRALEQMGRLAIFTARDDGVLIGYAVFFLVRHLHYADLSMAINDVLFLAKEQRRGRVGLRFIRYLRDELRAMGVHKMTMHAKYDTNLAPLLRAEAFKDEEMILGLML